MPTVDRSPQPSRFGWLAVLGVLVVAGLVVAVVVRRDSADAAERLPLITLTWDAGAGLWGADAEGGVWRFGGPGWEKPGTLPGQPQALLATPDALYAAVLDPSGTTSILQSTDSGSAWALRYRDGED